MKIERDNRRFDFHDIGLAIKRAREASGMTQEQLAYIVDRAPRTIMYNENDGQHPSLNTFCISDRKQYRQQRAAFWAGLCICRQHCAVNGINVGKIICCLCLPQFAVRQRTASCTMLSFSGAES